MWNFSFYLPAACEVDKKGAPASQLGVRKLTSEGYRHCEFKAETYVLTPCMFMIISDGCLIYQLHVETKFYMGK